MASSEASTNKADEVQMRNLMSDNDQADEMQR